MAIDKKFLEQTGTDKKYLDLEGLQKVLQNIDTKLLPETKGGTYTVQPSLRKIGKTNRGYVDIGADVVKSDITDLGTLSAPATDSKVFLAGTTVQGGTPTTLNSNASVYMIKGTLYSNGEEVALKGDVAKAVKFKGSVGVGGTIETLPTASKDNEGFMYKVITDGTYAGKAAKVGDTFICSNTSETTYEWILIPSGDEPAGTVTSIGIGECLTGTANPITSSGTISHATYTAVEAAPLKIGRDNYGHVVTGGNITVKASASHTHGFSGTVSVPTITPSDTKLSINGATTSVIKSITEVTNNLEIKSIAATTVSKAVAATPVVYGTADVGTKISITPAKANGNASYATFNKTITYGTANVGTATRYGTANVGTATRYGTANVGDQISIIPAIAGGTASYVTSSTYVVYGNANIGTEKTAVSSVGFADDKQAYEAKYDDTELALELTPITLSAQTFKFNPADQSSATFPVYTIKDVEVAKTGTAKTFNPAVAAPDTQTLTPAAEAPAGQTLTPAESAGDLQKFDVYSFSDVAVAKVDTAVEFTPAKAAATSQTITPYSFTDVSVAATTVGINYATGKVGAGSGYTGDSVWTGATIAYDTTVLTTSSKLKAAADGDVTVIDGVTVGSTTAAVDGSITGGNHAHELE